VVKDTVLEIKSQGVDAFPFQADISQPEGVDALFAAVREHYGRLNILVNSASNFQKRRLMEVTLDEWETTMRINVTAPFLCTRAATMLMQSNIPRGGVIVNICDRGALEPWPEFAHHGVSKAALLALSQVSAISLGPEIRVNAVIPGAVLKPESYSAENWAAKADLAPLKRVGSADDVARAVAYLCSEDYLTGVVIRVDGGEYLL
jgi:NAD(P)-dependent dehydrogenase (short-subunit alcohol dehydrogenase family)